MKKKWCFYGIPSIIGMALFYVVPFFASFYYAWCDDIFHMKFVGFSNFVQLFHAEYFVLASKNTIRFTIIGVPLSVIVSFLFAYSCLYLLKRGKLVSIAVFLPTMLPSAATTTLWRQYCNACPPFLSLLMIYLWKYIGINTVIMMAALSSIDRNCLEMADLDGASPLQKIFHVFIPSVIPSILVTIVLSVMNVFKTWRESYLLWGDHPDWSVYMLQNYLNNHFEKLNFQIVSAASTLYFGILFFIAVVVIWKENQWSEQVW